MIDRGHYAKNTLPCPSQVEVDMVRMSAYLIRNGWLPSGDVPGTWNDTRGQGLHRTMPDAMTTQRWRDHLAGVDASAERDVVGCGE